MSDNFYLLKRMFQVGSMKHVYEPGERTPYPIIIEEPLFRDIVANMKLPEWMPFLVSIPVGAMISYRFTKPLSSFPLTRRRAFTGVWGSTMMFAVWMGIKGSFYKLTGFEDNGLSWKTPDLKVKKYVFTQDMQGAFENSLKRQDIDSSRIY